MNKRQITVARLAILVALVFGASSLTAAYAAAPAATQLTTFNPTSTSTYSCGATSIAYNADSDKTFAVWIQPDASSSSGGAIFGELVDTHGVPTAAPIRISNSLPSAGWNDCEPTNVAAGPNGGWLVTWDPSNNSQIDGQLIKSDGTLLGANVQISSQADYSDTETMTASWSPADNRYLVTWKTRASMASFPSQLIDQQIVGRFIDGSLAGIGNDFLITNIASGVNDNQESVFGNGRWVVAFKTNNGVQTVFGQVLTAAGLQGAAFNLSSSNHSLREYGPSIAYNPVSNEFLTTFRLGDGTEGARILDGTGTPQGSDISVMPFDQGRVRIVSTGTTGFLLYMHTSNSVKSLKGQTITSTGVTDTPFELTDSSWTATGSRGTWRPNATYSSVTGDVTLAFLGNPGAPNESNIYSTYFHANNGGGAAPHVVQAPTMSINGISANGSTQVITGSLLGGVKTVKVNGVQVSLVSAAFDRVVFTVGSLAPGTYPVELIGSDGSLTWDNAIVIGPAPALVPVVVDAPSTSTSNDVSGFAGGSSALNTSMKTAIRNLVRGASALTCTGSTSGSKATAGDRALALARAKSACGYIKSLYPSIATSLVANPAAGLGAEFRKVTLDITN